MKLRGIIALAIAFACPTALAQTNPGTSPLSGAKGGTNNAFMQFSGPASSLKTFTLPNVSGTIGVLNAIQTWTGAQTISPTTGDALTLNPVANSYGKGFNITQTSPTSGSIAGPLFYNNIDINHQANVTGVSQAGGLHVKMNAGGSNMAGAGPQFGIYSEVLDSIAGSAALSDKIGIAGSCFTIINDSAGGGCYGTNSFSGVSGTGSINRLVGHEADMEIRSGGSASYRYAFSAVNETLGVGQASTLDAAYIVGNIGNASGAFKNAFVLSNSLGAIPLSTTGNVFSADAAMTVGSVLSFPNLTVGSYIWQFPNTTMDGAGQMTAQDVKVTGGPATVTTGQGTIGASANSGLILQGFGSSFDLQIMNKTGGTACVVPTGTTTLNCNTATLTNPLGVASGGTGLASGTSGGIPYFAGSASIASSALLTANAIMLGGGAGASPKVLASLGTTTTVLHGNAAGLPTFGSVDLTADVTATLPVANGGTGDTGTAWTSFTPSLSCGTATFTANSATRKTLGKTTWAQIDYTITAIGTCTNQGVTFTLPNTAQTSGSLNGQENVNSSAATSCLVAAASATATCRKAANVAFIVNDRVIVSGVYQNQ